MCASGSSWLLHASGCRARLLRTWLLLHSCALLVTPSFRWRRPFRYTGEGMCAGLGRHVQQRNMCRCICADTGGDVSE
eukprot:547265-Pelagomonas_calceolata.AAC.1